MKKTIAKFRSVPSFRKASIALVAGASSFVATSSFAAGGGMGDSATAALTDAQAQGTAVGGTVVGVVAALAVVGIIIALVRKV